MNGEIINSVTSIRFLRYKNMDRLEGVESTEDRRPEEDIIWARLYFLLLKDRVFEPVVLCRSLRPEMPSDDGHFRTNFTNFCHPHQISNIN